MALSSAEPMNPSKSSPLTGGEYELTLSQSIQKLVAEPHENAANLSTFIDVFYDLMQSKIDPPLETIWVYSALSFRSQKTSKEKLLDRVLLVKDLFRLITGCSVPCSSSKSTALLAPVVFEVYRLVAELLGKDLGDRRVKKVFKEVKSLLGVILGYVSVCSCKDLGEERDSNLLVSFADLVSVWLDGEEGKESFLPLLSNEMRREVSVGGCSVNSLAGVVMAEMLLLKLCFDLRVGNREEELKKELKSWVVGSITGFRSFYFFETLARMLLEQNLPVTSLLSSEDEIFLRKILYDAVVLVDYSFVGPERTAHLLAEHVRSLALKRLIITYEAINFFRKDGDQKRAISYASSFSNSRLPSQIIESVTSQIGMEEEASKLKGSSPGALIKWLLALEGQGARLFDDSISKHRAKLALGDFKDESEQFASRTEVNKEDADLLFYIDNKGEEEEVDADNETNRCVSADFVAAAHKISKAEGGGRKRKEDDSIGKHKRSKFLKHDISDDSDSDGQRSSPASDDSSNSDSEVDNPMSD